MKPKKSPPPGQRAEVFSVLEGFHVPFMRNTSKNRPNNEILLQNFLRAWPSVGRAIQFQTYSVFGKQLGILRCIGIIELSKV